MSTNEAAGGKRPWFRIEARAAAEETHTPSTADVFIYDEIGESFWGGGVSAQTMATELAALDVDELNVYINSPGGAAWDGIAIMNAIRRHRAHVIVHVDGLAASAASVIAMAGDRVVMNRGSELMIHDASGGAYGNAELMDEVGTILHKLSDSIADVYAGRTGTDRATWRAAMKAETWYTAEEAVAAGLADEWVDAAASEPVNRARFSARARLAIPSLASLELPSSPEPGQPRETEKLNMSDTFLASVRDRLGVPEADASEETVLTALDEVLTEQADTTTTATASIPEGTVLIEAGVLAELQSNAQAGVTALAAQTAARRDSIVAKALSEGRITPATQATWRAQLDANEDGTVTLLDSLAANKALPVNEIGNAEETDVQTGLAKAAGWTTDETEA
jgi:ATP-dependent protease ClpP protease subunit